MEGVRFAILFILSISLLSVLKAKDEATNTTIYIIWVHQPEGMQLEAFSLKTLSVVLGSMEAAKKALIYTYNALNGFVGSLNPKQAYEISKQPGVLDAIVSGVSDLLDQSPLSNLDAGLS